jgi:hypothetical protein
VERSNTTEMDTPSGENVAEVIVGGATTMRVAVDVSMTEIVLRPLPENTVSYSDFAVPLSDTVTLYVPPLVSDNNVSVLDESVDVEVYVRAFGDRDERYDTPPLRKYTDTDNACLLPVGNDDTDTLIAFRTIAVEDEVRAKLLARTDTNTCLQQRVVTVRLYFVSTVCRVLVIDCTELTAHNTVYSVDAAKFVIFTDETFFPFTTTLQADTDDSSTASTEEGTT